MWKDHYGRSKSFEKEATVVSVYPSIFRVRYEDLNREVSYQSKDVLTRTVEVDIMGEDGYKPLVPPPVKRTRKLKTAV